MIHNSCRKIWIPGPPLKKYMDVNQRGWCNYATTSLSRVTPIEISGVYDAGVGDSSRAWILFNFGPERPRYIFLNPPWSSSLATSIRNLFFSKAHFGSLFSSQLSHPTPPQWNILHSLNSRPTSVQPEDHLSSQLHRSDISMSSQK